MSYAKALSEAQEKLEAEIQARLKAEEQAKTEASERSKAEAKAESETAARLKAEQKARAKAHARSEAEKKLKSETLKQSKHQILPDTPRSSDAEASIIEIDNLSRKPAKCECCEREYPSENQLIRIDSGQMFCHDCLAELKSAALS